MYSETWVISGDGSHAWNWHKPAERIQLTNPDRFKRDKETAGATVVDDRGTPPLNVWD